MTTRTTFIGAVLALVLTILSVAGGAGSSAHAQAPPEAAGSATWRRVSAGAAHTCAIRSPGKLFCWGWNDHGQLGRGATSLPRLHPVPVRTEHVDWVAVAAGNYHSCAIRRPGRLYCWGDDSAGQLGNGPRASTGRPQEVAGGFRNWKSVTAGQNHTCALRRNGALFCWGDDTRGQVGDGAMPGDHRAPRRVPGTYRAVDAGRNHTCAVATDDGLRCWGDDAMGQLGNSAGVDSTDSPTSIVGEPRRWASVTAGRGHTCGVTRVGRAFCWGDDGGGQLGNGLPSGIQEAPVAVDTNDRFAGISAGEVHTCARSRNGEVACWGDDSYGQLGNGPQVAGTPSPNGALTPFSGAITAGSFHACSRTTAGRLQCWGDNTYGQVGRGTTQAAFQRPVVVLVPRPS